LAELGRTTEAKAEVDAFEGSCPPGYEVASLIQAYCRTYQQPSDHERWLEGFRKIGFGIEESDH